MPWQARRSGPGRPRWWWDNSSCRAGSSSCGDPEMIGLRPRQLLESDARQGAAAPRIFDAGPGESEVQVVAPVQEHSARLQRIAERLGARRIRGENRGGEAEVAVVHEPQRLFVGRDLHD